MDTYLTLGLSVLFILLAIALVGAFLLRSIGRLHHVFPRITALKVAVPVRAFICAFRQATIHPARRSGSGFLRSTIGASRFGYSQRNGTHTDTRAHTTEARAFRSGF